MRPSTLDQACRRIAAGEPAEKALDEFADTFYAARCPTARYAMIAEDPAPTGDAIEDAWVAAVAEYLAHQYELAAVPSWVFAPHRFLATPWFAGGIEAPAFREYLMWASPAEFRSRNLFTEERPLRRATQWRADQAMQAEREARMAAREQARAAGGGCAEKPISGPDANG